MHYPIDRVAYTTAFVTPVVDHWLEREIVVINVVVVVLQDSCIVLQKHLEEKNKNKNK